MFPEGRDQRRPATHAAERTFGRVAELPQLSGAEIRDLLRLEIAPDVLDGVEFGSVAGEEFEGQSLALAGDVVAHGNAAMAGQPVPDDEQAPLQVAAGEALQLPERDIRHPAG